MLRKIEPSSVNPIYKKNTAYSDKKNISKTEEAEKSPIADSNQVYYGQDLVTDNTNFYKKGYSINMEPTRIGKKGDVNIPNQPNLFFGFFNDAETEAVNKYIYCGDDNWLGGAYGINNALRGKSYSAIGISKNRLRQYVPEDITDYDKINEILRQKIANGEITDSENYLLDGLNEFEEEITALDAMVKKAPPTEYDAVVYRAIDILNKDSMNALLSKMQPGMIYNDKGYTSTSMTDNGCYMKAFGNLKGHNKNEGYYMRIHIPKGTKGINLGTSYPGLLEAGKSNEFILPRNSSFKITEVDHENGIIECEYLLAELNQ